ncbi:MAG: beta-lactamase family protein [Ruminococcaceae bacterium]|nr:beta-lactamase family protein [Oscillospiraceae bacterium]
MFENVKKLLDAGIDMGIPAVQVSVFHKGKEVFAEYRGVFNEEGTSLSGNELYNIYSCSKFITCTAALMLYEKGKFSLDDEIAEYISAFGDMTVKKESGIYKAEKRITIRQLFTMTSGMNYDCGSEYIKEGRAVTEGRCPTVEMMKYIAKIPLEFEPGTTWRYSLSHDVIAALVEVVSGEKFGDFVKKNIFDPLGMCDTTYNLPDEKLSLLPAQYTYSSKEQKYTNIGPKIHIYKFGSEYESGGAGAVSTVADYMKFLEGMRTGRLLKEETIALMKQNHLTEEQRKTCWASNGYGYGLGVRAPMGDGRRTDYGWGGAAGAFAAVDPEHDITLYYSQHVISSKFASLRKDYIEAAKLDLGYGAFVEDMWNGQGKALA